MIISDLTQQNSKVPRTVEATHKNAGNSYYNWVKLNNTGPSNRAHDILV